MDISVEEAVERNEGLVRCLLGVWRDSVTATHAFLTPGEVERIASYVPDALRGVPSLLVARGSDGVACGFAGVEGSRLEMLFVASSARGRGVGSALLDRCVAELGVTELTVNEQNPQAIGFYERKGFSTYRRTELDEQGGPYPLLHMRR